MKKKHLKKFTSAAFSVVLFVSFAACEKTPADGGDTSPVYETWSTYNTTKVMQSAAMNGNYAKIGGGITANTAKNETESAQFFITTGEKAIQSFELIAGELVNERGDKFPTEQIDVYAQKYIEVTEKTVGNNLTEYPVGWYPDAIVPMDLYKKFGENSVAANSNQGFTVDFITPAETPAGTYTGNFTLKVDSENVSVPVSLTVWNFALPEHSASQSCILLYDNAIMYGEMTTDTDEWYVKYYEKLLRYKMNAYTVPYSYKSPETMVENVIKYWSNPNFASYGMPHQSWIGANYMSYWHDVLYSLGENSTEDMILYDKGYFYPIDEPNSEEQLAEARNWMERLQSLRRTVADELLNNGVFEEKTEEFKNRVIESLLNFQIVVTATGYEKGLAETDVTFCPNIDEYNPYGYQQGIQEHAKSHDNGMWYYTANVPTTPFPTQHIDDHLVTTRIMKWQQKYYNLTGWLNWSANHTYKTTAFTHKVGNINPYEDPMRIFGPGNVSNGDGYFVYPAGRYEATEPIGSIRLTAYRDGQDDLDMLNYLDELYAEYEEYYGVSAGKFDVNNVLKGLYDQLFCRAIAFYADEQFFIARNSVAHEIENALCGKDKFVYTALYSGNYVNYEFYVADGYSVKADGVSLTGTQSGSGKKYEYCIDLTKKEPLASVVIADGENATEKRLYESSTLGAADVLSENYAISVSAGSEFRKGDSAVTFDVRSKIFSGTTQTLRFIPHISLPAKETFKVAELDLVNLKDKDVTMKLVMISEDGNTCEADISLKAGRKQTVEMLNRLSGKKIKGLRIEFLNVYTENGEVKAYADRQIGLSGVRYR